MCIYVFDSYENYKDSGKQLEWPRTKLVRLIVDEQSTKNQDFPKKNLRRNHGGIYQTRQPREGVDTH